MFLSKLALYGTIFGSFFAVSAFSTIQITKQMNKTPIPNETSEEEEEEEVYVRQMSDTERFINSLTGFGNMEGHLDLTLNKGTYNLALSGDVFVSMESMDDIKLTADLDITTLGKTFDIKATYLDGTIYTTLEGNNLKLETSSIGDITSMFSTMESSIELPEAFQNIDTTKLISNLSAMTAEKSEDHITYTCNLLEGIPPIIFTSDLEYNMTSITLSNCEIEGFKIDVAATTKILGKGHNKVVSPETENNPYTNITSYFGTIKQIKSLIDAKEAGINYNLALSKAGDNLLSTSGTANFSLNNGLELSVDGRLYNSNKSKSVSYLAGYQDNNVYMNFNDLVKVYYDVNHFDDLKSSITNLINNEDISKLLSNLESVELPIMKMINDKDYNGLLDQYKGLYLSSNQIKVTLSNSIFSDNNSTFDVTVNLDENGITDLSITNLRYNDYALSLSLELKEYSKTTVDLTEYDNVSNIDKVIDQINNLISSKKFALNIANISYGDYQVSGYIQADIVKELYQADITLTKATTIKNELDEDEVTYTNYRIRFENDNNYYYVCYSDDKNSTNPNANDVKLAVAKSSIETAVTSVKNLLNNKEAELTKIVDELMSKVTAKIEASSKDVNVLDILFADYLKTFDISKDELTNSETLNVTVNGDKLGLESDINLALNLDENTHISGITGNVEINAKNAEFNVNLSDFDNNLHAIPLNERAEVINEGNENAGHWVGISNVTNIINYVAELDNETQTATVNQIKNIIEAKKAGIGYNINVYKNKENEANELVFNIAGDVDLDLENLKVLDSLKVNFSGKMTNANVGKELDSDIDIKLYEGTVYFDYNDQLKFAYSINDIKDLVTIIKDKISNNSTTDISGLLDSLFPSNEDTTSSPIVNIIKEGNYLSLLNYYKNAYKDNNGTLTVVLDGALIGNDNVDISISLTTGHNGISNISINGVYALGYTLDCSFDIENYTDFEMSQEEIDGYTNLRYINNMFDQIYELVHEKEFKVTLNGNVNLGKGDLAINGTAYAALGENNDIGIANLTITDSKNKTHNIKLDVDRKKTGENALANSQVAFTYNNNLKGYFSLESINETFTLIKKLASDGNPLLDKIKGLLTSDSTQSTLNKIMKGEPEAILYDNTLDSITHGTNKDGSHYYDVQINGNLFKKDSDDVVSPIHILINMDEDNKFTGITLRGSINGYSLDITAGIAKEESNPATWSRLSVDSSYFDFSDMKTLVNYLFKTAKNNDYTLSGNINITLHLLLDHKLSNVGLNAIVHLDDTPTGKSTTAKVVINNIPHIPAVSACDWDDRTLIMYLTDDEVVLNVQYDYTEVRWEGKLGLTPHRYRVYRSDIVRLTMKQFTGKLGYYLVNYGFGIGTGTIDMTQTNSSNDSIDLSTILSSFRSIDNKVINTYDNNNNVTGTLIEGPAWELGISLSKLAGTSESMLGDLSATIVGDKNTETLGYITASTNVVGGLLDANLTAKVDSFDKINSNTVKGIKDYISACSIYTYEVENAIVANEEQISLI